MKKFKRILASILCISVLMSSITYAEQNDENNDENLVATYGYKFQKQEKLYMAYEKIMDEYEKGGEIKEYYGGAYLFPSIDFNILIDKKFEHEKDKIKKQIEEIINDKEITFEFRFVKHNYTSLINGMELLNKLAIEKPENPVTKNINGYFLDEQNNCIKVNLVKKTPDKLKEFQNETKGYTFFEFFEVDKTSDFSISNKVSDKSKNNLELSENKMPSFGEIKVKPGTKIQNEKGDTATVAYKAKDKNGNVGIVTAAHLFDGTKSTSVKIDNKDFGEAKDPINKNVDAIFIAYTRNITSFDISNQVKGGKIEKAQRGRGGMVGLLTFVATGHNTVKYGNVKSNYFCCFDNNRVFSKDLICTGAEGKPGDSGSPLCLDLNDDIKKRKCSALGLYLGGFETGGYSISIFEKIGNIEDNLGVKLTA